MDIYDLSFTDNEGNEVPLSNFKNKVLLFVNVASNCGFTNQYAGLQLLHEKYADKGLQIIGFPCNQFGGQEPGTDETIKDFCKTNYGVTFLMSKKIDVNGDNAHPIYNFLTKWSGSEIAWNFEKFIVNKDAKILRDAPDRKPEDLEQVIKANLV
jgi:glutathione peroxidase